MTKILLSLFFYAMGTEIVIQNKTHYDGCNGVIVDYEEYKDVVYYTAEIKLPCRPVRLKYLKQEDFYVP